MLKKFRAKLAGFVMQKHKHPEKLTGGNGFFFGTFAIVSILIVVFVVGGRVEGSLRVNALPIGSTGSGFPRCQSTVDETLAAIGREITEPYILSKSFAGPKERYAAALPGVPAAVLLVLAGFFCVSLVKDRKVWLALVTGVLCLSQSGLQAMPDVIRNLSVKIRDDVCSAKGCIEAPYRVKPDRLRASMEGSEYIGLVYHRSGKNKDISEKEHGYRPHKTALSQINQRSSEQFVLSPALLYSDSAVKSESLTEIHIILLSVFSPGILSRGPPLWQVSEL